MKKWVLAVTLTVLLPLLSACFNAQEETTFDDPAYLDYAGRLTLSTAVSTKAKTPVPGDIVSIELTESGLYVLGKVADTEGNVEYQAGTYNASGEQYSLNGFGKLSFDNSQAGAVTLTVTPAGGEPQTVSAKLTKGKTTNQAYRSWIVEKTRVTTVGWTTVSAEFNGCNFKEIAAFLRANAHKVPDEIPHDYLSTLSFTGTEAVILTYDDSSADMGAFSLNGNVFTYTWKYDWMEKVMGFTFETDKAIIEYIDGKCVLTINGRIQNSTTSGSVTFLMSPME